MPTLGPKVGRPYFGFFWSPIGLGILDLVSVRYLMFEYLNPYDLTTFLAKPQPQNSTHKDTNA